MASTNRLCWKGHWFTRHGHEGRYGFHFSFSLLWHTPWDLRANIYQVPLSWSSHTGKIAWSNHIDREICREAPIFQPQAVGVLSPHNLICKWRSFSEVLGSWNKLISRHERPKSKLAGSAFPEFLTKKPPEIFKNHLYCFKSLKFVETCYTAIDNWYSHLSWKSKGLTRMLHNVTNIECSRNANIDT